MQSSLYLADLAFLFHTPEYFYYWHKSFHTWHSVTRGFSLSKTQWGREKAQSYRRVSRAWITYVFLWFRWGTRWGGQRNFQGRNEWARRQCFPFDSRSLPVCAYQRHRHVSPRNKCSGLLRCQSVRNLRGWNRWLVYIACFYEAALVTAESLCPAVTWSWSRSYLSSKSGWLSHFDISGVSSPQTRK